jgi:hypothetical protein
MSAPYSSRLMDVVKIVEVAAKARKGSALQQEYVPACACEDASDIACASVTVRVVVDPPLVVSSGCTDCDRIDGNGGVSFSSCCCCREPYDPNELADCSWVS